MFQGAFGYIPGSILLNLSKKISQNICYMSSVFISRAIGHIVGSIIGAFIFEYLRFKSSKWKHLAIFSWMLLLSLMSLAIAHVTTMFKLLLVFGIAGTCVGTLIVGVDAICLSSKDIGVPFYQKLSTVYALGCVFAPVLSRDYYPDKHIREVWPHSTVYPDTVSHVYHIFAAGAFVVSFLWLLQHFCLEFHPPIMSESDGKSEDIKDSVLKCLAIFNISMLSFFGMTIYFIYVLLLPAYSILVYGMNQNQSCDFMTLFLGIVALGRLTSHLTSNRIEPPNMLLIGISLVLFAVVIMYLKLEFFGSNYWSSNSFIAFGSGPLIPSTYAWLRCEFQDSQIYLIVHIAGCLSELVVPAVLSLYIWEDDGEFTNRNGFLLTVALLYLFFFLCQHIVLHVLSTKRTLQAATPVNFRAVTLSHKSPAGRTWRSLTAPRLTSSAGLETHEDEEQKAISPAASHENVIKQLSEVKSRIATQNQTIRLTLRSLVYSGSQLK